MQADQQALNDVLNKVFTDNPFEYNEQDETFYVKNGYRVDYLPDQNGQRVESVDSWNKKTMLIITVHGHDSIGENEIKIKDLKASDFEIYKKLG